MKPLFCAALLLVVVSTARADEAYQAPPSSPATPATGPDLLDVIRGSYSTAPDDPTSFAEFITARARLLKILSDRDQGIQPTDADLSKRQDEAAKRLIDVAAMPNGFPYLIGDQLSTYLTSKMASHSAPQATQAATETSAEMSLVIAAQNSTIIEQNKQIIALLQEIADKK